MRQPIASETAAAVLTAAADRGRFTPAPGGALTALVWVDGYGWTVTLPARGRARITSRQGLGGLDAIRHRATRAESALLRTRARPAPAYPAAPHPPPAGGTADDHGRVRPNRTAPARRPHPVPR